MKALVVVDVQVDFCEGGALAVVGGNAVAQQIAQYLAQPHCYAAIVATRDHHIDPGTHFSETPDYVDSWPPHCVVGTPGQELHPVLHDYAFEAIFDKGSYSAAYSGFEAATDSGVGLADWLNQRGITELDICGIATDYCVQATALDAAAAGYSTTVRTDLTAAVHPESIQNVLDTLTQAGVKVSAIS